MLIQYFVFHKIYLYVWNNDMSQSSSTLEQIHPDGSGILREILFGVTTFYTRQIRFSKENAYGNANDSAEI